MTVNIHSDVVDEIGRICGTDTKRRLRILDNLDDLAFEPEPSQANWRNTSSRVGFLVEQGYEVRRLQLTANLPEYRFFYLYDEARDTVFVMEIVPRDKNTYNPDADHIEKVKKKYDDYFAD